jgi:hypothetical protein
VQVNNRKPEECGNDLKEAVSFSTSFVMEARKCPLGQIGDTTNQANERPCVCDRSDHAPNMSQTSP